MSQSKLAVVASAPQYTVADLATMVYPSDRYPLLIVARTRKVLTVARLDVDNLPEHVSRWPVVDWILTLEEAVARVTDRLDTAQLHRDGKYWMNGCCPVAFGRARYYRDWSD